MQRQISSRELGVSVKEMILANVALHEDSMKIFWEPFVLNTDNLVATRPSKWQDFKAIGAFVAKTAVTIAITSWLLGVMKDMIGSMDPQKDQKKVAKNMRTALQKRLSRNGRELEPTTMYENLIAQDLVNPEDISVKFDQIGGLQKHKQAIYELVVLPLRRPELFRGRSKLHRPPKGVLLHGAPGTGKTMLAKAIAKESGAAFLNLRLSTLLNKYFGESQQLVRALFSLAQKLSPTIIFIDEIDGFLRSRSQNDHECVANMKAEFMQLWDGMMSESTQDSRNKNQYGVIIIGATNRVKDIDTAILRRMPRAFAIGLPGRVGRRQILEIMLAGEPMAPGFDLDAVAADSVTGGYSGADLKELCRAAAMRPLQELLADERRRAQAGNTTKDQDQPLLVASDDGTGIRPMRTSDLLAAVKDVRTPKQLAEETATETCEVMDSGHLLQRLLHALLSNQSAPAPGNE